jgi:tRNA(Ile)-lysidine synthase
VSRRVHGAEPPADVEFSEFSSAMERVGPWEPHPTIAVAVSGGSDSMALALLAGDWTRRRSGRLLALIVDHGLRAGSAAEAERVRGWLEARAIAAEVLSGREPPRGSLQERARRLRHRLLVETCIDRGIRHLLFAHHLEDQAETVLMRMSRGSGLRGLAGIAPAALAPGSGGRVRLLRPLLRFPKARLRAALRSAGQDWVEDPSNADPKHERVRWRALMSLLAAGGVDAPRLGAGAMRIAEARASIDRAAASWLAEAAAPSRYGHVRVRMERFDRLSPVVARAALERLLGAVGGQPYPPRGERLSPLIDALCGGGRVARTLAGCALRLENGVLLVLREAASLETCPARPGRLLWDGRFELRLEGPPEPLEGITISCLGPGGLAELRRRLAAAGAPGPRAPARQLATIPALWRGMLLLETPHFPDASPGPRLAAVAWTPRQPLAG